ncbi:hypothetical protein [Streptococcus cristatus]|uniref:Uncharacterized protein n=1 Tax=Streptococcus cristatus TaxID=45634 RepID=A0A139N5T4_STRCR|nr:hypothetical protein [Streptococcus cristatus]KXT71282.1 hypothetical protein SCRDD08_00122 [Streptococcus cristatus]
MDSNKTLPVQEYLAVKKEAYYSMTLMLLVAFSAAGLSFVLLYSGSRQRIFESIMIGSLLLISSFVVRPYWVKKRAFETAYPELKAMSIRGAKVPSSYLMKRILVFSGEFILLIITFNSHYHPIKPQENLYVPQISDTSSDRSLSSSDDASVSEESSPEGSGKKVVHVPTVGDVEVDLGSIRSSISQSENESEVSTNE